MHKLKGIFITHTSHYDYTNLFYKNKGIKLGDLGVVNRKNHSNYVQSYKNHMISVFYNQKSKKLEILNQSKKFHDLKKGGIYEIEHKTDKRGNQRIVSIDLLDLKPIQLFIFLPEINENFISYGRLTMHCLSAITRNYDKRQIMLEEIERYKYQSEIIVDQRGIDIVKSSSPAKKKSKRSKLKFTFGKHRGKTIKQVCQEERSYLNWLVNNWRSSETDEFYLSMKDCINDKDFQLKTRIT